MRKEKLTHLFLSCSGQIFYPDVQKSFRILEIPSERQVVLSVVKLNNLLAVSNIAGYVAIFWKIRCIGLWLHGNTWEAQTVHMLCINGAPWSHQSPLEYSTPHSYPRYFEIVTVFHTAVSSGDLSEQKDKTSSHSAVFHVSPKKPSRKPLLYTDQP